MERRFILLAASALFLSLHGLGCDYLLLKSAYYYDSILERPHSLTDREVESFRGRYQLNKIVMQDHEGGGMVDFSQEKRTLVEVDSRQKILYEGQRTFLSLDPERSTLEIDDNNVCSFKWAFKSSDETVRRERATLHRIYILGDKTVYGCLKDNGTAEVPSHLVPLHNVSFKTEGSTLIFVAKEDYLEELIYFDRL